MARNEEKAMNLFNKWHTFKQEFHAVGSNRRPLLASECDSLVDAEKWRREIIRDLTKKSAMIQNASLGEFKIRDLNDEINKLMKQKHYWDIRIRELGGGEAKRGRQFYEIDGKELPGQPGYRYYGAAKELPGVRELFAEESADIESRKKKKKRVDYMKYITPDYYGYRDDDDGKLIYEEKIMEEKKVKALLDEYHHTKHQAHQNQIAVMSTTTTNSTSNSNSNSKSSKAQSIHIMSNMEDITHQQDEDDFENFLNRHLATPLYLNTTATASSTTGETSGTTTSVGDSNSNNGGENMNIGEEISEAQRQLLEKRKLSLLSYLE